MIAERPTRAAIEAMAREGYRKKYPGGPREAPSPANGRPALLMIGADSIHVPYRGRMYELGHVSFEDGIRLVEARAAIMAPTDDDATPEKIAAYLQAMRFVVRLAPRYMVPVGLVRRFFWRLRIRRNPFRTATDSEVGHILGFFLVSRMRSRVPSRTATTRELAPIS